VNLLCLGPERGYDDLSGLGLWRARGGRSGG
jgi:hypothetical protein